MTDLELIQHLSKIKHEYDLESRTQIEGWITQLEAAGQMREITKNPAIQQLLQSWETEIETINLALQTRIDMDTFTRVCKIARRDDIVQLLKAFKVENLQQHIKSNLDNL